jgi:hypothetical protein
LTNTEGARLLSPHFRFFVFVCFRFFFLSVLLGFMV